MESFQKCWNFGNVHLFYLLNKMYWIGLFIFLRKDKAQTLKCKVSVFTFFLGRFNRFCTAFKVRLHGLIWSGILQRTSTTTTLLCNAVPIPKQSLCSTDYMQSRSGAWKHILYGNPHRYPVMVSVMYTNTTLKDTHSLCLLANVDATANTVKDCWITSNHAHSNIIIHTNTPLVLH